MEKLLRTETEAALDDAVESCKAAADFYRDAADAAPPDIRDFFRVLEGERRRWAALLEEEVRRMGNLPSAPDADREALDFLITRVKAVFSRDERSALLQRGLKTEEQIVRTAETALGKDLPPSTRELLGQIKAGAQRECREMTQE